MKRLLPVLLPVIMVVGTIALVVWASLSPNYSIFDSRGIIASDQKDLFITVILLSLIVIIPVFSLVIFITWRYRESNHNNSVYAPDWEGNRTLETIWWLVPTALITILSVIIIQSSHRLDPFRPIVGSQEPLVVEVVAMQWKWLFMYPEQDVAAVNELYIPTNRPIELQITADAPMSAIWIPQLGGQIYAMSGMKTKIYLQADEAGIYDGVSTNINGEGFAGMTFKTHAVNQSEFNKWVSYADDSTAYLSVDQYQQLAVPSKSHPVSYFSGDDNIFNMVLGKYTHISPAEGGHY